MEFLQQSYLTILLVVVFVSQLLLMPYLVKKFKSKSHKPVVIWSGVLSSLLASVIFFEYESGLYLLTLPIFALIVAVVAVLFEKGKIRLRHGYVALAILSLISVFLLPPVTSLPGLAEKPLLLLVWLFIVNSYRLISVQTQYLLGVTVIALLGIALIVPMLAPLAFIAMFCMVSLISVVREKAKNKILLGASYALCTGYIIAGLVFAAIVIDPDNFMPLFGLLSFFILEVLYILVKRLIDKKSTAVINQGSLVLNKLTKLGLSKCIALKVVLFINFAMMALAFGFVLYALFGYALAVPVVLSTMILFAVWYRLKY